MARHRLDNRPQLPGHGRVEDYTDAFLASAGCIVFMALMAIWALAGFLAALLAAGVCRYAMTMLVRR